MERRLQHYMTPNPQTISSDAPCTTALQVMRVHRIRHLPVVDGAQLVGIVTERDLRLLEATCDVGARKLRVADAMTRNPFTAPPTSALDDVIATMLEHQFRSAIVTDEGRVVGIFTTSDVLRVLVSFTACVWGAPTCNRWGSVTDVQPTDVDASRSPTRSPTRSH